MAARDAAFGAVRDDAQRMRCSAGRLCRSTAWPQQSKSLCSAASQGCSCCAQGVQGISDIITIPGLVNVDFADVKAVMCNSGTAMLGVGVATGKNRAEEAALVRICLRFCVSPSSFGMRRSYKR